MEHFDPSSIPLPDDIPLPPPPDDDVDDDNNVDNEPQPAIDLSNIPLPSQPPPPPGQDGLLPPPPPPLPSMASNLTLSEGDKPARKRRKKRAGDYADDAESLMEREAMARIMGFSSFDSTKGKQVPGNHVGAVHVVKKRRYRQYMNRKGGFNRPLDKVA